MILVIPLPLFFAQTIYTARGLATWVSIGIAWVFCSLFAVVIYPLYESRHALTQITRGIIKVSPFCATLYFVMADVAIIGYIHKRERKVCCAKKGAGIMQIVCVMSMAMT